jgi:hypothetical protein
MEPDVTIYNNNFFKLGTGIFLEFSDSWRNKTFFSQHNKKFPSFVSTLQTVKCPRGELPSGTEWKQRSWVHRANWQLLIKSRKCIKMELLYKVICKLIKCSKKPNIFHFYQPEYVLRTGLAVPFTTLSRVIHNIVWFYCYWNWIILQHDLNLLRLFPWSKCFGYVSKYNFDKILYLRKEKA